MLVFEKSDDARARESWVQGKLVLSEEFRQQDEPDQVRGILTTSIGGAARVRGMTEILSELESGGE